MQADRASETCASTTGTGTYDLDGAVSASMRTFVNAAGNGAKVAYVAEMDDVWEIGWGIASAGTPETLTRNLISSSTGALISWGAGTKLIYSALPEDFARFGAVGSIPTATGTGNAQAVAHLPPLKALLPGMSFRWIVANANSGATTLAVDAIGAAAIRKRASADALVGGDLPVGQVAEVVWDGTYFRLLSPAVTEVQSLARSLGAALVLTGSPATRWVFFAQLFDTSLAYTANQLTGVAAGGETLDAGVAGSIWSGIAFRVS